MLIVGLCTSVDTTPFYKCWWTIPLQNVCLSLSMPAEMFLIMMEVWTAGDRSPFLLSAFSFLCMFLISHTPCHLSGRSCQQPHSQCACTFMHTHTHTHTQSNDHFLSSHTHTHCLHTHTHTVMIVSSHRWTWFCTYKTSTERSTKKRKSCLSSSFTTHKEKGW